MGFSRKKLSTKKFQFSYHFDDFTDFFLFQEGSKILKIQKNHDFSENRSKIEFWCSNRSDSPSFWKYRFGRSFWCIYHSYNSFFHLVWIIWMWRPSCSKLVKIQAEFRRICMMFNDFSWKIWAVWKQSVFAIL